MAISSKKIKDNFIKKFEEEFYLRVRNYINSFLNLDESNLISLGLFLQLPIQVSLTKITELPQLQGVEIHSSQNSLKEFLRYFSAYTVIQKENENIKFVVHFSFLYQNNEDLDRFLDSLNEQIIRKFLSFAYLHELQHILRRHTTKATISIYEGIVKNFLAKHKMEGVDINLIINSAFDYAINYPLFDLIWDKEFREILEFISLYDKSYHKAKMSELTILEDLLKKVANNEIKTDSKKSMGKDGRKNEQIESSAITIKQKDGKEDKISSHKLTKHQIFGETIEDTTKIEREAQNIANSIAKFIKEKQKGNLSNDTLSTLGAVIKVKADWVKELINSIYTITRDITHQYISTWGSLKNQYRKIGLFPNKKFLRKTSFVYASIDQSGSMSNEELRKINYILTQIAKKVNYLHIIIHDFMIVQTFQFGTKSEEQGRKFDLSKFIKQRYSYGGTSHEDVFKYLDKNVKKSEIMQSIYISFSDNMSDIEEKYYNFKVIKKIKKFWVTTDLDVDVAGKKISMR